MDCVSSSAFGCSGGKGRGGGGGGGGGRRRRRSRLYGVCLFFCLCFSAAVAGPATRPPPPVYASSPTKGDIDSSLYYPADASCLMAAIKTATTAILSQRQSRAATLLRLVFHDCMTKGGGCDASILKPAEINNPVNDGLSKVVDIITAVRKQAATQCGVLPTLADTIARAAAAAVSFSGLGDVVASGFKLGRRDVAPSQTGDNPATLPNENQPLDDILNSFASFGLSVQESTVWSIGGHSIGEAGCIHFTNRLNTSGGAGSCLPPVDPTLDPVLACKLAATCAAGAKGANFDFVTPKVLDVTYFQLLLKKQGLLKSDQAFAGNARTAAYIQLYANSPGQFAADFLAAYVKVSLFNINGPTTAPPTQYYFP
ncbi:Class III Peroxidase [Chara braunii]|uniref:Peroxidase n=1 Tax=Chara braunii TaxID=69332 RepID=A0A388M0F5_CHABU|nr:Class III Peroxidase [Chara braunii]|eukprot:GBG87959.1 Class III Peroxidase [Chara braunii]